MMRLSLALLLGAALEASAARSLDPTLATMVARLTAQTVVQPQFIPYWDGQVDAILALMLPGGNFSDLDYSFQAPALWPAYNHTKRVEWLTAAWITPGSAHYNSSTTLRRTMQALDWWLVNGPLSKQSNWWWWTIGVPITLGISTNVLAEHLAPNQTLAAAAQLAHAHTSGMTDANLVWCAEGVIYRGLLTNNATLVQDALRLSFATVAVTSGSAEGIKADGAFFQHGAQIYNGGYGSSYVQGIAMMLSWTRGTPLGLPDSDPRVAIYSHLALDGTQRMMTFGVPPAKSSWGVAIYDVSVIGRDLSRPYGSNWGMQAGPQVSGSGVMPQGYGLTPVLMAGVGGPRAAEFVTFAALLNGSATPAQGAAALLGNRVFYTADYAAHASASGSYNAGAPPAPGVGWMATVRAASTRTLRCEAINGENKLGAHLSDGALYLYVTGHEFVDAFPCWDWQRVPGTTVVANALSGTSEDASRGTTSAVGGASDGRVGSAVLDVATAGEGLHMRRSVFFFDDLYAVLGANITSTLHTTAPVYHSIAQRRLSDSGVYTSSSRGAPLPADFNNSLPAGTEWVWEGGVGVVFLPNASTSMVLRLDTAVRSGDWRDIGAMAGPVVLPLFVLSLEFAPPVVGAAFAYVVVPNLALAAFQAAAAALLAPGGLALARNDGGAQALLHGAAGVLQASVWALDAGAAPQRASLDAGLPGWHAAVDAPGAFIVRAGTGALAFTAASPSQAGAWSARLAIDRNVPAANATCGVAPWAVVLNSPPGDGSSQTVTCASD